MGSILLSPFQLGRHTLKNRFVFLPHNPCLGENNMPSEKQAHYFKDRAKGGTGLIILGSQIVHPSGTAGLPGGAEVWNFDDAIIPGYRRITDFVHENGARIVAQLAHFGSGGSWPGASFGPAWSPSGVVFPRFGKVSKAMETEDIHELQTAYALASLRSIQGGFDGVELKAANITIFTQFLSPITNKRNDLYGGTQVNRARFLLETIATIRSRIGREPILGIRLTLDELTDGGFTMKEGLEYAIMVAETGLVDYIYPSLATVERMELIVPPMATDLGFGLHAASLMKKATNLPTIGYGRVKDPLLAEEALQKGYCDLVGFGRALICDPELPAKTLRGELGEIRPCLSCNQSCMGNIHNRLPLGCVHNPAVGKEATWGIGMLTSVSRTKRIVVVGGGPAGMKFTEVAAVRGHRVTLIEARHYLGGNARTASLPASRKEFFGAVNYLETRLSELPVEIRRGTAATVEMVMSLDPEVVVMATGSREYLPPLEASIKMVVSTSVLEAAENVKGHAVVVGEDRHWITAGVVEYLADVGCSVDVLFRSAQFVPELDATLDKPNLMRRLAERKVSLHPQTEIQRTEGSDVVTTRISAEGEERVTDVNLLVFAGFRQPNDQLYLDLKGRVRKVYCIGDALVPRRLESAIFEGESLAREV